MSELTRALCHQVPARLREAASSSRALALAGRLTRAGHVSAALDVYADLIKASALVRESIRTYRRIEHLTARATAERDAPPPPQRPEQMLLFVGYSRSGHSLVGSLLDAHPDAVIAHELHLLKHLRRRVAFDEVCRAALLNAWLFERGGRAYSGYDYTVPGQHQGRYRRLQILGDKKGNGTLRLLRHHPRLVDSLLDLTPTPLTLIHVIRDPFDNIATRARRKGITARQAARGYFANADVMTRLKDRYGNLVMDVYLDDLVANPAETLGGLLRRLELETSDGYLRACAKVVFDRPRRTRDDVRWEAPLVREVRARTRRYPFLERFAVSEPSVHAR